MRIYQRLYVLFYCVNMATAVMRWTTWFNMDDPSDGNDIETLKRLREIRTDVCTDGDPVDIECRLAGKSSHKKVFNSEDLWEDNFLTLPCNTEGVSCLRKDQTIRECRDFEIRFYCPVKDTDSASVNGGFIAMAAGFSVIIPLVCVLLIQLKKSKRQQNGIRPPATTECSPAFDPPPSYSELFGNNGGRMSQRTPSTEVLLVNESEQSVIEQSNSSLVTISGSERVDDIQVGGNRLAVTSLGRNNSTLSVPALQLSVNGLVSDYFNDNDVMNTPPPSYSEALEILKMAPKKS